MRRMTMEIQYIHVGDYYIVNPVCTLCRDHEQSGLIHGVQVGIRLAQEVQSTE